MSKDVDNIATCGCCQAWIERLTVAGFKVITENTFFATLMYFTSDHRGWKSAMSERCTA